MLSDRFWAKVEKTDGCWLWRGSRTGNGYGQFIVQYEAKGRKRKQIQAHRMSLILAGRDPGQHDVHHRCETPLCVRPRHLEVVADNRTHMSRHGRDRWDRERIVAAAKEAAAVLGRSPTATDWNPPQARSQGLPERAEVFAQHDWPHYSSVTYYFGKWSSMLAAAGLPPHRTSSV